MIEITREKNYIWERKYAAVNVFVNWQILETFLNISVSLISNKFSLKKLTKEFLNNEIFLAFLKSVKTITWDDQKIIWLTNVAL